MSEWQPIETAPRDGTRFVARGLVTTKGGRRTRALRRVTWFGKTSHVPLYGWCHGRDVENIDLWQPTHWRPRVSPPAAEETGHDD